MYVGYVFFFKRARPKSVVCVVVVTATQWTRALVTSVLSSMGC